MGYFSNGSEGDDYEHNYCSKCLHGPKAVEARGSDDYCAVWQAHLFWNYDEYNKPDSILHLLIPRAKSIGNERCKMFITRDEALHDPNQGVLFEDIA